MIKKLKLDKSKFEYVECPICEGRDFKKLVTNDRYNMGIITSGCNRCGLVMTNPQPNQSLMEDFYLNHYRAVYQKIVNPTLEYVKQYKKDERANNLAFFLNDKGLIFSNSYILDFGCAEGSLMKAIKEIKKDLIIHGIESNVNFGDFAATYSGCNIFKTLDELDKKNKYDLIVINHVLEHMQNPLNFLADIKDLLNENGKIYIDVPSLENYGSIASFHVGHLYHFSKNTLEMLSLKCGFRILYSEYHQPVMHPKSVRVVIELNYNRKEMTYKNTENYWYVIKQIQRYSFVYLLKHSLVIMLFKKYIKKILTKLLSSS